MEKGYIVDNIDRAIQEGWIVPYYQPVIRTISGYLCGAEALARWEDPVYGFLAPDAFISELEAADKIHKLDICIIERVCEDLVREREAGREVIPISFNLSRRDFELCDIFTIVDETITRYEIPKNMIRIEITESMAMDDPDLMHREISKFHNAGYQVWMDDFGSAYSSLNVLKDYDFDEIKLDMVFLSDFSEKSKQIISFIIDMSKRIGVQTLAEGVETHEEFEFLRSIGCEKVQGYYFGKPQSLEKFLDMIDSEGLEAETVSWNKYYDDIGRVDIHTDDSVALVEYNGEDLKMIFMNERFKAEFTALSIEDDEQVSHSLNKSRMSENFRELTELVIETKTRQRINFYYGGNHISVSADYITSYKQYAMLKVELVNISGIADVRRSTRMEMAAREVYSFYDNIWLVHLDKNYIESVVYENSAFSYETSSMSKDVDSLSGSMYPDVVETWTGYRNRKIYPEDRARYKRFSSIDGILERLDAAGGTICEFFRTLERNGKYAWKLHSIHRIYGNEENIVMGCVRRLNAFDDDGMGGLGQILTDVFDGKKTDSEQDVVSTDAISDAELWRNAVRMSDMCIFWKDKDRRFLGASRAFMEYYDIDSVDSLIGKTDEDMGWHINEKPYMEDELRILQRGERTHEVPGMCIIRGKSHNIVSSKMPIYRDGNVIGLMGMFRDMENLTSVDSPVKIFIDDVSGLLNTRGIMVTATEYIEEYRTEGTDFSVIYINLKEFRLMYEEYGEGFCKKMLGEVGAAINRAVGKTATTSRIMDDRFVILLKHRSDTEDEVEQALVALKREISKITSINGHDITVYYASGSARFSEAKGMDDFLLLAAKRAGDTMMIQ